MKSLLMFITSFIFIASCLAAEAVECRDTVMKQFKNKSICQSADDSEMTYQCPEKTVITDDSQGKQYPSIQVINKDTWSYLSCTVPPLPKPKKPINTICGQYLEGNAGTWEYDGDITYTCKNVN